MIEEKIKEVENYFIDKVVNGDYEFIGCNEHVAEIVIDKKYLFELWIANGAEHFKFYGQIIPGKKDLCFRNAKQRNTARKIMMEIVKNHRKKVVKVEKEQQIKKLKRELKRMEL